MRYHCATSACPGRTPVRGKTLAERSGGHQTRGASARRRYPGRVPSATSAPPARTATLRIWTNGRLHEDPDEARVAVTDHGLVVGDGVFEALKVTPAGPFAVQRHLDRLTRSAASLGLPAPDHRTVRAGIEEVLDGQSVELGKIRITYTGGPGPLGSQPAYGPQTLVVALDDATPSAPTAHVVTAPWTRNERGALAGVKSTSYAENVRVLAFATERGASEGMFLNTAGHVCEGTGSNVFAVLDGAVVTPPLAAGALAGITRELLLEWCDIEERDLGLEQYLAADEVFLTSSLRDVQPVHRWDETTFGAHPVTDAMARTFAERAGADLDP